MFNELSRLIVQVFTMDDLYLNRNSRILNHFDISKGIRDMRGKVIVRTMHICNLPFEFVILKDTNGYTTIDMSIHNNNICFYIVLPHDIGYDDYDKEKRKSIIYSIFNYIINYISKVIPTVKGSSMQRILELAPEVLTINLLSAFAYTAKELTSEEKGITDDIVRKIINESVEDLLDNEFILSIIEGR